MRRAGAMLIGWLAVGTVCFLLTWSVFYSERTVPISFSYYYYYYDIYTSEEGWAPRCPDVISFDHRLDVNFTSLRDKVTCLSEHAEGRTVVLLDPRIVAADCILDDRETLDRTECLAWAERYFDAVQRAEDEGGDVQFLDALDTRSVTAPPLPLEAEDGRWGYFHDVLAENEWSVELCGTWVSERHWYVCPEEVLWATTLFVDKRRDYALEVEHLLDSIVTHCPLLARAQGLLLHYTDAEAPTAFGTSLPFVVHAAEMPTWIRQTAGMSRNFIRTAFFDDAPAPLLDGVRHVMLVDADIVFLRDPLPWVSPRHLRMAPATTIASAEEAMDRVETWQRHGLSHVRERKVMRHCSGEKSYWFYNGGQVWAPRRILEPFLAAERRHAILDAEQGGDLHYRDMFMMAMAYYEQRPPFLALPVATNLDAAMIRDHADWVCRCLTTATVAYHYHNLADARTGNPLVPDAGSCPRLRDLRAKLRTSPPPPPPPPPPPAYGDLLLRVHRHLNDPRSTAVVVHQHTRKAGGGELRHRAYTRGLFARGACEIQNACLPADCATNNLILITSIRDPVSRLESDFNWEGPGGSQAWARTVWPHRLNGTDAIETWSVEEWRAWMRWPTEGLHVLASESPGVRPRGLYIPNYATQLLGAYHQEVSDGGFTAPVGYADTACSVEAAVPSCQPRMIRRITDRQTTARMLANAKRVLQEAFVLAVPSEHVGSTYFWDYVAEHGGQGGAQEENAPVHVNAHRFVFPDEIRAEVLADNWADQELYEFVQRLHRDRDPCRAPAFQDQEAIFLISMHKTATTTWRTMMQELGHRVVRAASHSSTPTAETWWREMACTRIAETLPTADAFQDVPWFLFYAQAAEALPRARFVFIGRPEEEWLASALHHFTVRPRSPWRGHLYGEACNTPADVAPPDTCREVLLQRYREHNEAVRAYFDHPEREHRILWLEIHNLTQAEAVRHAAFLGHDTTREGSVPVWKHMNRKEVA